MKSIEEKAERERERGLFLLLRATFREQRRERKAESNNLQRKEINTRGHRCNDGCQIEGWKNKENIILKCAGSSTNSTKKRSMITRFCFSYDYVFRSPLPSGWQWRFFRQPTHQQHNRKWKWMRRSGHWGLQANTYNQKYACHVHVPGL